MGKGPQRIMQSARRCWPSWSDGTVASPHASWLSRLGGGIRKAVQERSGTKLLHQRWTLHKDRTIQRPWPTRWRKEAQRRVHIALEPTSYAEAKARLIELEGWRRTLNESAADALREAVEDRVTVPRRQVPALLRTTGYSTTPIASMVSTVRATSHGIGGATWPNGGWRRGVSMVRKGFDVSTAVARSRRASVIAKRSRPSPPKYRRQPDNDNQEPQRSFN